MKNPEERRKENIMYLDRLGISYLESLPYIEPSTQVRVKDLDTICKRVIACLFAIQLACDINAKYPFEESKELFQGLLRKYGVEDELLPVEQKLFNGKYSNKDVLNVTWDYETIWSLYWALGFVEDMKMPSNICDCRTAIQLVGDCKNYEEFKTKCNLRDVEEILDMLDLYYQYDWACVEKRINPDTTSIGELDPEVVNERRKGLEWLISQEEDWNEISLDT